MPAQHAEADSGSDATPRGPHGAWRGAWAYRYGTSEHGAGPLAPAVKSGVWSRTGRVLEPRVREIFEAVMAAPWATELDELGAMEIARLETMIEAIDADIARRGLTSPKSGSVRAMADLRLRASRRLADWLDRYGLSPLARSEWASKLASGGFAERVERRMRELEAESR